MSQLAFRSYSVADVSTRYVTEEDGLMLVDADAPSVLGVIDHGRGALLYLGDPEEAEENVAHFRASGWSEAMCALVRALNEQGFEYLRLDADGADIEGGDLPTFDW